MIRPIGSIRFTVALFIIILIVVEFCLQAADLGWIGTLRWRSLAYQNGAFWSGLLRDWMPNYPLQPAAMFASYALLHSGLGHLTGNVITIAMLGEPVCQRVGQRGFVWISIASAVGGGLGFALLNTSPQPMVGTSGVVFGLAGALTASLWDSTRPRSEAMSQTAAICGLLIVLNAIVWWSLDGLLAWETHLGGFIAGGLIVFAWPNRLNSDRF